MTGSRFGGPVLRGIAVAWLLVVGPLNMASTVSRLLPRLLDQPAVALLALTAARACAAALGVAVGLSIVRAAPGVATLSAAWVALEVSTLALVWFTDVVPSNRPPGLLVPTIAFYLSLAALVWTTTHRSR